jgi:hypothetical protein
MPEGMTKITGGYGKKLEGKVIEIKHRTITWYEKVMWALKARQLCISTTEKECRFHNQR